MITFKSCPNCKSRNIRLYKKALTLSRNLYVEIIPGVKLDVAPVSPYSICSDCDLIFQNPRMSDEEIKIFYSKGYYRKTLVGNIEAGDLDEKSRAEYDTNLIKQFTNEVKSHLDIGCGRGYLLDLIGAQIKAGVEEDQSYVKIKGIKVYQKLDEVPQMEFDLVTAIHVVEHEPHTLIFLKNIRRYVNDRGIVVIEVPSWDSPGGPLRLAHLYHFEPHVLVSMCEKAGLSVISQQKTPHLVLICKKRPLVTNT